MTGNDPGPHTPRRLALIALAGVFFLAMLSVVGIGEDPAPRIAPGDDRALRPAPSLPPAASSSNPERSELPDPPHLPDLRAATLAEQRANLLQRMASESQLSIEALARVRAIFQASPVLGQGNPKLTEHPMTRGQCQEARRTASKLHRGSQRCGAPNMVAVYDPSGEATETARLCIDQFEFPNLACEYPVVHVKAREAALLCEALGKRLCDAHEWEGACAGALRPPETEHAWGKPRRTMTWLHNEERGVTWAYGTEASMQRCATMSRKSPGCVGGYVRCGTNSYPTGAFPSCVSRFGVYDQHGNVAEHMSLPLAPEELGSRGGHGSTEMKGSWFVFASDPAHPDDCRWRAKDWHPSRVLDPSSHSNYHLGFRCCKDL